VKVYVLIQVGDHTNSVILGVYASPAAAFNARPDLSWKVEYIDQIRSWVSLPRQSLPEWKRLAGEWEIEEREVQE
jgi:hypothetical protein